MAEIVQNKLGGLNERALPTDSVGFNRLMAAYAAEVGLMARVPGKALLSKQDGPVFAILQFWTPFGYAAGLFQFTDRIALDPWTVPSFHLPLTLDGQVTTAEISEPNIQPDAATGTFTETDDTRSGMHGGSGRRPRKILLEDEPVDVSGFLQVFQQLTDASDSSSDNPNPPGVLPSPLPFIDPEWGTTAPSLQFVSELLQRTETGWHFNYDGVSYWNTYQLTTGKKASFVFDLEGFAAELGIILADIISIKFTFDVVQYKFSNPTGEGAFPGSPLYDINMQPKETTEETVEITADDFNFEIDPVGRVLTGMHDGYGTYNGNWMYVKKTFTGALITYYTWRM